MKRIKELLSKLCSVKGIFSILMTVLLFLGKVDSWMTFSAWTLFILGREYFKTILELKK